jgi:hypothetical protein
MDASLALQGERFAMWDFIPTMLKWIVPPPDADVAANHGWRWRIATFTAASFMGVLTITILAFGLVPAVFAGFASSLALQDSVNEQRQHWVYQLDTQILSYRVQQCHATTPEARQLYFARMQWLMEEYQRLTKQAYPLPACTDL